ncbi:hemolytic protein HlpA [Dyadobacter beijingensis]|uniref:Hemolytic protein HlpA n=1 Tax=Dyadobacter beijingensis TaxID=365489 RepID=A0ABQ2I0Z8_9BACT|nr:hypothetical protein [Dyadobacter beijingensis]GGM96519.1 hemolytic protein HlpA [Dyadobacter beijingensis]
MYKIISPVLLNIFNRPDTTQRVFEKIREGKPGKLYIAADGPRPDRENENVLCEETRKVIKIDWDCEVHYLYRNENLGCKMSMSGGIKWFFENEPEGIVLEDDCLPGEDFFRFCDTLLEKYRYDTRVAHIAGTRMAQGRKFGDASYYFSKFTHIWGWASWRRVWENYDENLTRMDGFVEQGLFSYVYDNKKVTDMLTRTLKLVRDNAIDTWDYQYLFLNFWNNSLCICPNVNLISNIGFDTRATHTTDKANKFANLPVEPLGEISHPPYFVPILDADYYVLQLEEASMLRSLKSRVVNAVRRRLPGAAKK